jgi:CubicO group peptidase (beta-lactamase class C family)
MDSLINPLLKEKLASGTILISINGSIVFSKAYGMADIEKNIPCTENTKYKLASITKTFTALSVMQLYEQGKLDLNDKLIKYLPGYLPGERISIFNLLTHTSGIPSYIYSDNKLAGFQEIIERIKTIKPGTEAGEIFDYSNSGYALLAYIIEKVSGMEYEKYVEQNIFAPTKMSNSGIISSNGINNNLAQGYSIAEYKGIEKTGIEGSLGKGDGALYSTAHDMYNYFEALWGNILVSANNLEKMFTPYKESYGLGWIIEKYGKYKVIYHHGGSCGTMTNLKTFVTDSSRVTVICLFNNDYLIKNSLNEQIEHIALGEPWAPIFENSEKTIKSFHSYTGTYSIGPSDNFVLSIQNNKIFLQNNDLKKCETLPLSDSSIYVKETNSVFKFKKEKDNEEISLIGFIGTPEMIYMVEGKRISK